MNTSNEQINSEIAYLYNAACMCREARNGYDGIRQIVPFFASIPYNADSLIALEKLESELANVYPPLASFGRLRANKAYGNVKGTITKPSYLGRMTGTDGHDIDQLQRIVEIAVREPASGGLCFSVFMPQDLVNRRRPGYVPCLMSGSFLLHDDEWQMNVFFRSQSVVEFAIYDLLYLRSMQMELVERFARAGVLKTAVGAGALNMSMGRVFVHRRMLKRKDGSFLRRDEILDEWITVVHRHLLDFECCGSVIRAG
jgi:hypothetical protein